jgi:ComF family protein
MNLKSVISNSMLNDFFCLLFPVTCASCKKNLYSGESFLCTYCRFHLPETHFHLDPDNHVSKQFWGRVQIQAAAAYCFYQKGEKFQNMIHAMKYRGMPEIGYYLGKMYGLELMKSEGYRSVQVVLPVPLHDKKLRLRGYNQSDHIVKGISEAMGLPWHNDAMKRIYATTTQTRKSRYNRWQNVTGVFGVRSPEVMLNKHVLLVDDVITTGSTLEAAANAVLAVPGTTVSVAALGYAK